MEAVAEWRLLCDDDEGLLSMLGFSSSFILSLWWVDFWASVLAPLLALKRFELLLYGILVGSADDEDDDDIPLEEDNVDDDVEFPLPGGWNTGLNHIT